MSVFRIPNKICRVEQTIKKSRFIATCHHTPTIEAAKIFVRRVKDEFKDATHNCWAYVAGPPGTTLCAGMSDDGEQRGTAGKPMLTTLLCSNIGEIACVVTRYYGGIKLGKGGLVRAYTSLTQKGIAHLNCVDKIPLLNCKIYMDYTTLEPVKRLVRKLKGKILDESYSQAVLLHIRLPESQWDGFNAAINAMAHGKITLEIQ